MAFKRTLEYSYSAPIELGFLGQGHPARSVIQVPYSKSDPFIALMDDMLQKQDSGPSGGPNPHAGFETVSLMLDGEIGDMIESLKKRDFQIMTAGNSELHLKAGNAGGRFVLYAGKPQGEKFVSQSQYILFMLPSE
jgi:quercetin 2,3-dioxygenase